MLPLLAVKGKDNNNHKNFLFNRSIKVIFIEEQDILQLYNILIKKNAIAGSESSFPPQIKIEHLSPRVSSPET